MATLEQTIEAFKWVIKEQRIEKLSDVIDHINLPMESVLNPKKLLARSNNAKYNQATGKLIISANKNQIIAYAWDEKGAPISSDLAFQDMEVGLAYVRAKFVLFDVDFLKVKSRKQALINLATEYNRWITTSLNNAKARYMLWDGTWIIWVLPKGVSQATDILTVSKDPAWTAATQNFYAKGAHINFVAGMKVQIWKIAELEIGGWVVAEIIDTIDETSLKLKVNLSTPVGWTNTVDTRWGTNADTYYVVPYGEFRKVQMGIFWMISSADEDLNFPARTFDGAGDSIFQSKVRKDTGYLNSIVREIANKDNIMKDFRELYTDVSFYNQKMDFWVVARDVYTSYTDKILATDNIYIPYASKMGATHSGLEFKYGNGKIAIHQELFLPLGTAILMDPNYLWIYHLSEWYASGYINKPISTSGNVLPTPWFSDQGWIGYETVKISYMNVFTYQSRKLWGLIRYES